MDVDQQMHVIGFAAKLEQLATPRREDFAKGLLEVFEQIGRQSLAPVLRHKNNVSLKVKNSMRARSMGVLHLAS